MLLPDELNAMIKIGRFGPFGIPIAESTPVEPTLTNGSVVNDGYVIQHEGVTVVHTE